MARVCQCDICHGHRQAGSPFYHEHIRFSQLEPLQQRIQLERHAARGVCPHLGPPWSLYELNERQRDKYAHLSVGH